MLALVIVLGLVTGSFLTSFIVRLREGRDFIVGRSQCSHCRQTLGLLDLIPVASYLFLGGRCRHCKKPIGGFYPVTELIMATVAASLYIWWPFALQSGGDWGLFYLVFVIWVLLVALALYDLRWYLLPNRIVFFVFLLALVALGARLALGHDIDFWNLILSCLAGGGLFYLLFLVSERYIGGGDVKLGLVLGFLLADWQLTLLMLIMSSCLGTLFAVPAFFYKKRKEADDKKEFQIPFGPFLILSTLIAFLVGSHILDWYFSLL